MLSQQTDKEQCATNLRSWPLPLTTAEILDPMGDHTIYVPVFSPKQMATVRQIQQEELEEDDQDEDSEPLEN
jgi:hypothetical protein